MSITDELRERIDAVCRVSGLDCKRLTAIADRIDAAHADAVQREHMTAYDAGYDEGYASADDWMADNEDAMAEHGWYRALAADKTTIRIGDKVDSDHHEDGIVMGVQFYEMPRGIRTLVAVRPDGWDVATWHTPDEYRHHAPTVEDVLRDMLDKWGELPSNMTNEAIVAEYAAKLRLAGSDAE